ncbi:fasciclin-like arabinogalactan protein 14 [Zingiber officinale]|uniref:FAS1 domain-containing protein n=1 Tax=Zingiber officinale TaxID=94328 RepID=A0A8J5FRT2_ZINOF|nr:fasciclin-like arabinogalactan protein 14 [Zingiber officinale]KAG6493853.1 hypothetical protein ZIOFF_048856 [Zingiber officinale]
MASSSPFILLLLPFVLLLSPIAAHNVTRILADLPDFSAFNQFLSQSLVAAEINRRQTITVLVVDNAAAAPLSSLDAETLRSVLSIHVILDYFDTYKIHNLRRRTTLFTTLYQTTGVAENNMGFLNFTHLADDRLAFGSGVKGSPLTATYVKAVTAKPYNISVLQISGAIVPPGITDAPLAPFGAPITVVPEPLAPAPAPADDDAPDADAPAADSPAPTADSPAPAPDSPAPASGPAPDSDASAPGEADEDNSSAGRIAGGITAGLLATVAAVLML